MRKASLILSLVTITTLMLTCCGQSYKEVKIGNQIWMAENLNVDKFCNGDPIPHAKTDEEWAKAAKEGTPVWCYYDNDLENGVKYGKLYNWFAVNDSRGLAPKDWRMPSDAEWAELTNFLGDAPGIKLKAKSGWDSNGNGTDNFGFSALPGGYRYYDGSFGSIKYDGHWWSATEYFSIYAWARNVDNDGRDVSRSISLKEVGFSVRCLRD
jgi:uncharacterized protein (TIGR02145 family)